MSVALKKSSSAEKFLYRYGKFLGLSPFTLDDDEKLKFSYIGLVYGLIVCAIFAWIFVKAMGRRMETQLPGETIMAMITNCSADFFQIAGMFSTWIIFAFRQRRIITIVESFIDTGVTASKIGIVNSDRDKFFKRLRNHVVVINFTFATYLIIDHVQLLFQVDFENPTYFIVFNGGHVICRNIIIIFVDSLLLIRERFARLNETTKNLATNGRGVRNVTSFRNGCERVSSLTERLKIVGQLHRELTDLAEEIRDFCSLPLLIIIAMHFIQLVSNCYITWMSIVAYRKMDWQDMISFVMVFIWLGVNIIEPFTVTYACCSTSQEARRTATVLHEMWNECGIQSSSCNLVVHMVSLSLLQNRLQLTLYGFFDLDFNLMYKIFGTTTTYVIIMMQLDQQQAELYRNYALRSNHFH